MDTIMKRAALFLWRLFVAFFVLIAMPTLMIAFAEWVLSFWGLRP